MTKHTVKTIQDFDISQDGRKIILNFADENDQPVSLKMTTIELERASQEMGFAITKARKLSDVSKQGIISSFACRKVES